jgi:hypothetical protein
MNDKRKHGIQEMKRHRLAGAVVLVVWLLIGGLPAETVAQQQQVQAVRTLVIKNNRVFIDGREIDKQALPDDLRIDSVSVSYSFIGIDEPVVNLRNQFFAVRPDKLELIPGQYEVDKKGSREDRNYTQGLTDARGWIVDAETGQYYSFQGERLEAREAVPKLLNEANNLYLSGLQARNQSLFSRLSREQVLEAEASRLAALVKSPQHEAERDANKERLVAKLNEIFEFKQANRRAEIAQFERELARLRERLERREAQKERLISRRLELLTKEPRENQP